MTKYDEQKMITTWEMWVFLFFCWGVGWFNGVFFSEMKNNDNDNDDDDETTTKMMIIIVIGETNNQIGDQIHTPDIETNHAYIFTHW